MTESSGSVHSGGGGEVPDGVVVRFTLSRREFTAAWYRLYAKRHSRFLVLLVLLAIVLAVDGIFAGPAVIAAWLIVCVVPSPFVVWRRLPSLRSEQTHRFTAHQMWSALPHVRSEFDWGYWDTMWKVGTTYVLTSSRGATFVPHRAFASPEDETRFREFAATGISLPV
jgi:hypothetical protein